MAVPDHNRIIRDIAREVLAPLGLIQEGRSRTWVDDQGWWLAAIEFQPSDWSAGSYVNAFFMQLFEQRDYMGSNEVERLQVRGRQLETFDPSNREEFTAEVRRFAELAASRIQQMRRKRGTPRRSLRYVASLAKGKEQNIHTWYDAAIASALLGKVSRSERLFREIAENHSDQRDWVLQLQSDACEVAQFLGDAQALESEVRRRVSRTRELLELPDVAIVF
jgi:hypothetical protein